MKKMHGYVMERREYGERVKRQDGGEEKAGTEKWTGGET